MSSGYTFVGQTLGVDYEILYTAGILSVALAGLCGLSAKKIVKAPNPLVPDGKFSIRFIGDLACSFILSFGDSVLGKENRKYLPFAGSIFIYLLFLNLSSLIPGLGAETGGKWPETLAFNFGIALTVFVFYHFWGIYELGIVQYFKHFLGGPAFEKGGMLAIGLVIAVLEMVSNCIRPLSLSLRLYGNITGDHLVLGVFTDLTKFLVPVVFYALGTFVSFMQAFVFMMLTMVFIKFAVERGHGEVEHKEQH